MEGEVNCGNNELVARCLRCSCRNRGWLLGSTYQQRLSLQLERQKIFDQWRRDAYVTYLNTLDLERLASTKAGPEARQLWDRFELEKGAATNKLAVFGESAVVRALAAHWRKTEPKACEGDGWKSSLAFFKVMRESAMPREEPLSDSDLAELAIRCTPAAER